MKFLTKWLIVAPLICLILACQALENKLQDVTDKLEDYCL